MDAQYERSELIALYDRLNAADEDRRFYRHRIGRAPKTIIDLGCGTGAFALELADAGFDVVAIDPAAAVVAYARQRDVGRRVRWIEGDAEAIPEGIDADHVLMTGHAFQCLLTDEAISSAFLRVRKTLKPGGAFLFETRNPRVEPWTTWNPDASRTILEDGEGRRLVFEHDVTAIRGELVSFVTRYDWPDRHLTSDSTLRFISKPRLEAQLLASGFDALEFFGNWNGAPFEDSSPEIIVSARCDREAPTVSRR